MDLAKTVSGLAASAKIQATNFWGNLFFFFFFGEGLCNSEYICGCG